MMKADARQVSMTCLAFFIDNSGQECTVLSAQIA